MNLASCFAVASKCIKVRSLHTGFIWHFFHNSFKDHPFFRSYSCCRSYSKVSSLNAKKYVQKLITELYTPIQSMQLAFADGSADGALCISQCMDRVFLNSSFLFYYLVMSIFCFHCMSFNTLLSSKWCYL